MAPLCDATGGETVSGSDDISGTLGKNSTLHVRSRCARSKIGRCMRSQTGGDMLMDFLWGGHDVLPVTMCVNAPP